MLPLTAPVPITQTLIAWARTYRRMLMLAAITGLAMLGLAALHAAMAEVRPGAVRGALAAIAPGRIAIALALTTLSYLALTLYDHLALRSIAVRLPWRTAALASFTSYALSHNLGLSLLTGGSARYRVYSAAGLGLADIARVSLLASAAFWGGVLTVAAAGLIGATQPIGAAGLAMTPPAQHLLGILILAIIAGVFVLRVRGVDELRLFGFVLPVPPVGLMAAQIGVAAIDLLAASAALFVLVPGAAPDAFGAFFLAYAIAIIVALVTHVPGGIGVFEAVILAIVPGDRGAVFAALIMYRLVYYLLPLGIAAVTLALVEGARLHQPLAAGVTLVHRVSRALAPPLLALMVFGGGMVLIVSGALPALHARAAWLAYVIPLPFVEGSHFVASIVGTALLLVAPAINARLRTGFHAARALLLAGAAFSIARGLDYEEAMVLLGIAAVLQYCWPAFYRRAGVLDAPIQRTWIAAASIALAVSVWAGTFAYRHVPYSSALWWDFAWHGDAPRFLRASLGASILLGTAAVWRLLSAPVRPRGLTHLPADVAARAFAASSRTDAALALTGDKQFLVAATGDAFLMYQVRGRSWIAMGDPVGPMATWPGLLWRLRAACDAANGRLCVYQASDAMLPLLVDMGLLIMKYGDEAHVDLANFSLETSVGKSMRQALRRAERGGLAFEVVPAAHVPAIIPRLRIVSDRWLETKGAAEKAFSVGRFDPAYLARFDMAVLRLEGRIIAFANLWPTANREELSSDLMRYLPDAPHGTMDVLFLRLMQWGAAAGYQRFNLGMAPLSGLNGQRLAPMWSRIGHAIYDHGEALYGFAGLRAFKAKFRPSWTPRYVATPHGFQSLRAMVDLIALVGG
jgi:phosphatidylglycerol lysyltransferase